MKTIKTLAIVSIAILLTSCSTKQIGETLAKNSKTVSYEVKLTDNINCDYPYSKRMDNLDRKMLVENLFTRIKNGALVPYDPYCYEKENNTVMTWYQIEEKFDAGNDTVQIYDVETKEYEYRIIKGDMLLEEIEGMIFIEEWNMGKDGSINKTVLGVAPVRYWTRDYGSSLMDSVEEKPEIVKRIVCICYFGDKRPPIEEYKYW